MAIKTLCEGTILCVNSFMTSNPNQNHSKGNWIVFLWATIVLESLIAVGYKQFYITAVLIDVQICWQNRILCQTVCVKGIQILSLEVYLFIYFLLWVSVVVIFCFHAITIILVLDSFLGLLLPYRWQKKKQKKGKFGGKCEITMDKR